MSILFDYPKNEAPKRLDKKVIFEVPLNIVLLGSIVFGSGIFALSIWFMREVLL